MKDPTCRVAPERGGPSRERRPHRLSGAGHKHAGAYAPSTANNLCHDRPERRARSQRQKTRTLNGGGKWQPAHAGGKAGLVGFQRLHMKPCSPIQCACGAFLVKTLHPVRIPFGSVRHQPRSLSGALRGEVPLEGVDEDALRLHLRGRLSPPKISLLGSSRSCRTPQFLGSIH